MTTPQTAATTDPQSMAALQQKLDAALSEKAALAEGTRRKDCRTGSAVQ